MLARVAPVAASQGPRVVGGAFAAGAVGSAVVVTGAGAQNSDNSTRSSLFSTVVSGALLPVIGF